MSYELKMKLLMHLVCIVQWGVFALIHWEMLGKGKWKHPFACTALALCGMMVISLWIDFGFFNGALTGTVEAFLKKNDNMLVAVSYPAVLGDAAPTANVGKFKDWGYEGSINYNGKIGDVLYHVGGNITFARNELTDYGGTSVLKSGYTSSQQGYSLYSIFGLRYAGKIQNEEQLKAYEAKYYPNNGIGMPSNLRVGDNMYCDENGDGVLDYRWNEAASYALLETKIC